MAKSNSASFLDLLESGNFSDAVVKCEEETWKVHKAILCSRSDWFNKAFNGPFKEGQTGVLKISETPSWQIGWLLKYLYGGKPPVPLEFYCANPEDRDTGEYGSYCQLYKLGDFFGLDELREQALSTLEFKLSEAHRIRYKASRPSRAVIDGLTHRFKRGVECAYRNDPNDKPYGILRQGLVDLVRRSSYKLIRGSQMADFIKNQHHFKADVFSALREDSRCYIMLGMEMIKGENSEDDSSSVSSG